MSENKGDKVSLENVELNEYIKDYLKFNGLKNSFECFEAEINAQRMSSKLQKKQFVINPQQSDNAPRLYSMLKEENFKTKREQNIANQLKVVNSKYLQILQSARHLFAISVNVLKDYSQTEQSQQEQEISKIESYKRTIIQYRKLIFSESEDPKQDSLTNQQVKEIKQNILQNVDTVENKSTLLQNIIEIRTNALKCKYNQREQFCSVLQQEDIFDIQQMDNNNNQNADNSDNNENNNNIQSSNSQSYVNNILKGYDYNLKTQILPIISIALSTSQGRNYLYQNDKNLQIMDQVIRNFREQDNGNISQRFCLAIMYKMSDLKQICEYLFKNTLQLDLLNIIIQAQKQKIHIFCIEYASALLANIICDSDVIIAYSEDKDSSLNILTKLIQSLHESFNVLVNKNIMLCLSKFKTQLFNEQLLETSYDENINQFLTDISNKWEDEFGKQELLTYHASVFIQIEEKKPDFDEQENQLLRGAMGQEDNNNKPQDLLINQNQQEEFILFEHFNDEIDNSYTLNQQL